LALTAVNEEEATIFKKAGVNAVFSPFVDSAEHAADDLTSAMNFLPASVDWPIAFRELRVRPDTALAGKTIRGIQLRSVTGATILAVSRAGRVFYDPDPDFRIYPGDRLVIMGGPDELRQAEGMIDQMEVNESANTEGRFDIFEIQVGDASKISGKVLSEIRFRQRYGVTVVGIRRGKDHITAPKPEERILAGDCLLVIGASAPVDRLKKEEPL
jgi:K+/H+ antiporter YhaU regulatory subunit KhtT